MRRLPAANAAFWRRRSHFGSGAESCNGLHCGPAVCRGFLLRLQMGIKPVGDDRDVRFEQVGPAVCGAFLDDELGLDAGGLELFQDQLRLLDRNERVGVAVDDQRGWIVGRCVIDRADLAGDFRDPGLVGDRPEDLGCRVLILEIKWRA